MSINLCLFESVLSKKSLFSLINNHALLSWKFFVKFWITQIQNTFLRKVSVMKHCLLISTAVMFGKTLESF